MKKPIIKITLIFIMAALLFCLFSSFVFAEAADVRSSQKYKLKFARVIENNNIVQVYEKQSYYIRYNPTLDQYGQNMYTYKYKTDGKGNFRFGNLKTDGYSFIVASNVWHSYQYTINGNVYYGTIMFYNEGNFNCISYRPSSELTTILPQTFIENVDYYKFFVALLSNDPDVLGKCLEDNWYVSYGDIYTLVSSSGYLPGIAGSVYQGVLNNNGVYVDTVTEYQYKIESAKIQVTWQLQNNISGIKYTENGLNLNYNGESMYIDLPAKNEFITLNTDIGDIIINNVNDETIRFGFNSNYIIYDSDSNPLHHLIADIIYKAYNLKTFHDNEYYWTTILNFEQEISVNIENGVIQIQGQLDQLSTAIDNLSEQNSEMINNQETIISQNSEMIDNQETIINQNEDIKNNQETIIDIIGNTETEYIPNADESLLDLIDSDAISEGVNLFDRFNINEYNSAILMILYMSTPIMQHPLMKVLFMLLISFFALFVIIRGLRR